MDNSKLIQSAKDAYYNTAHPIMSDAEYDALVEKTGEEYIGAPVPASKRKIKHAKLMPSLDKCKTAAEFKKFFDKFTGSFTASEKMDGLACSIVFKQGVFAHAATRGDGQEGQDITDVIKSSGILDGVRVQIAECEFRGELIITTASFQKLNEHLCQTGSKPMKAARNAAVGIVNSGELTEFLSFYGYAYLADDFNGTSGAQFKACHVAGFNIPLVVDCATYDECLDAYSALKKHCKTVYDADGVVFCSDTAIDTAVDKNPTNKIAFKFENEVFNTSLKDIEWSVGSSMKITPVAIFDAVNIDGVEVSRANLANISFINAMGLRHNSVISVIRSGDVIPKVTGCVDAGDGCKFVEPEHCPSCLSPLEKVNNQLFCTNAKADHNMTAAIERFVKINKIDAMGRRTIEAIHEVIPFTHLFSIYKLKEWRGALVSMQGFGPTSVDKYLDSIEQSRNMTLVDFLRSLHITGLGERMSKRIIVTENPRTFEEALEVLFTTDCVSANVKVNISSKFDKRIQFSRLATYLKLKEEEQHAVVTNGDLVNEIIVLTGKFEGDTKPNIKKLLEARGATVSNSVNNHTTMVLVGSGASRVSSKEQKAIDKGITIKKQEELL